MKSFKYNRWLILVIIIGLVASLVIDFSRHEVEQANKQVDLAVDYEGLLELSEREGVDINEVFRQAREAGISSLAVYETTFKKLNVNGKATAAPGGEILKSYHNGTLSSPMWRSLVESGRILGNEIYITGHHKQTFGEVKEGLIRRLGSDRVQSIVVDGEEVLAVKANYEAFEKMNISMPTDEMKIVNDAGFYVLARPSSYDKCTPEDVEAVFKRLDGFKVSELVFSGKYVLGGDTPAVNTTAKLMRERHLNLGLIEGVTQLQFFPQAGMLDLARGVGYDHVVRVYSIDKAEMLKIKLDTAVERWVNTDEERNIRVDLLRIFEQPAPHMSLLETNMKYFKDTHDRLVAHGFTIGPASTYSNLYPSKLLRALVVMGVAAAFVLYLSLVIPMLNSNKKWQLILLVVFALAAAVPILMGGGNKIRTAAALASANLFPALAVIFQLDRIKASLNEHFSLIKMIITGAVALFVTGALSYVGAAYLSGSLADVEYLLEFNIFRGIKLTFILPIILVAIAFLQRFDVFDGRFDNSAGVMAQLKEILNTPVRIKTLIGLGVVLLAGIVFIARSGHTMGMPVSATELKFRAFLEQAFYARPRSKELLIGHPAFMLAFMAFKEKWPTMVLFILVLVATIGQGSMVETFAHMRTPIYMSFMRGIGGLVLGAGIGAIAMVLVHFWQYLLAAAKERRSD